MKNVNKVVHFGCGALGRGLVIPLLTESGKNVTAVDTNEAVLDILKEEKGYNMLISDEDAMKHIPVKCAVSSVKEKDLLRQELSESSVITTSVKRENLKYLIAPILEAWGQQDGTGKMIICCENVEHVGSYFRELLMRNADEEQRKNVAKIKIPNTIVDRICSMDSRNDFIVSESFHELAVDKEILPQTHIEKIASMENLEGHFYRKRYLLNSYADAASFLARGTELRYLYEAVGEEKIDRGINPYMELLKLLLNEIYHISKDELEEWQKIYKKRLSNKKIPRELSTVARNLWEKLTLEERFIKPLVQLKENGHDISDGLWFIKRLLETETAGEKISKDGVLRKLEGLWCTDEIGNILFQEFAAIYKI